MHEFRVIFSKRRTLAIHITENCEIIVKSPVKLPEKEIQDFVNSKERWINRHIERINAQKERIFAFKAQYSAPNIPELRVKIEHFLLKYKEIIGVEYLTYRLSNAKTVWGSCNATRKLSFNKKLYYCSNEIIEYVVVHELCHIKEMNHGKRFWNLVEQCLPEYKKLRKELKSNNWLLKA